MNFNLYGNTSYISTQKCLSVNYVQAISRVASVKMPSVSWELSTVIPLA